jgi:hypothetical protein
MLGYRRHDLANRRRGNLRGGGPPWHVPANEVTRQHRRAGSRCRDRASGRPWRDPTGGPPCRPPERQPWCSIRSIGGSRARSDSPIVLLPGRDR